MNFNDLACSIVTLFAFMVVNNWTLIVQVYIDITGSQLPILYFILFWILIDLIIFNLIIAVILEIYGTVENDVEKIFTRIQLSRKVQELYKDKSKQRFRQDYENVLAYLLKQKRREEQQEDTDSFGEDESWEGSDSKSSKRNNHAIQ